MALIEGRGLCQPGSKTVNLMDDELETLERLGRTRANFRGYANRQDRWGRGFRSDAIFIGLIGELVVAKYINEKIGRQVLSIDTELRKNGDGGFDLKVGQLSIDVKTARTNGRPLLIRRINEQGRIMSLGASVYVLVDAQSHSAPELVGWVWRKKLTTLARTPLRDARHFNLIVERAQLLPMDRLVAAIQVEMMKRQGVCQ